MLRINVNISAQGAKSYYTTSDYYSEGQELVGRWGGKAADQLGLSGNVQQRDWDALCDNRDPGTGKRLTPRTKQTRRIGYDFNFHAPKSLSLLYSLTKDERLLDAFEESVDETMCELEGECRTRVRKSGQNEARETGNMAWGRFTHLTARPVAGEPDPHLHAHCFVFNTTYDPVEERWKAAEIAGIKRDAPYFEAVFHSKLSQRMSELGLAVDRTRTGWELAGLARQTLDKFSRRTALIEKAAQARGITDAAEKAELGAKTREAKRKELTFPELQERWRSRLTSDETASANELSTRIGGAAIKGSPVAARDACERGIEHCFERESVVGEREVLTHALKVSYGQAGPEQVSAALGNERLLRAERDGRRVVTSPEVLAQEKRMIAYARNGRGTCGALGKPGYVIQRDWLSTDQRKAVERVLSSHDRVVLVRGIAGSGKTTMLQETADGIAATGKHVFAFAPSADASRGVLRNAGFDHADTVSRLLVDTQLQASATGQVLLIDEAGLLGTRTMAEVFDLADRLNCRVILSGDRRQHRSVERGSALRLLESEAGLIPAQLKEIRRQSGRYRDAVRDLSEGRVERAFCELGELGWIRELPAGERYAQLARDYVETVRAGESALVVSPTHREGDRITGEIRVELQRGGELSKDEQSVTMLTNLHLTVAERKDAVNYQPGDVLIFHQNAKGYRRGDRLTVGDKPLPLDQAARFEVFRAGTLVVAPGEVIRIMHNGKTETGLHRVNNGTLFTVKKVRPDGGLSLTNGWELAPGFGHVAHGYVTTSHSAQGSSVQRVFIGQSADAGRAASREQFYVSVSRGKRQAVIYTDDKPELLASVMKSSDQLTATELERERHRHEIAQTDSRTREQELNYERA